MTVTDNDSPVIATIQGLLRQEFRRYANVEANLNFVAREVKQHSREGVLAAIRKAEPNLAVNSEYSQAFSLFFQKYPHLKMDSNQLILEQAHHGCCFTLESIEAWANDPKIKAQLRPNSAWEEHQKELREFKQKVLEAQQEANREGAECVELENRLLARFYLSGTTTLKPYINPPVYKKERQRLESLGIDELRAEATSLDARIAFRNQPVEKLREIANQEHEQRQVNAGMGRYSPLPAQYSPPNRPDVQIPWSRKTWQKLPLHENKRLVRIYGIQAIEAALAKNEGAK